MSGVLLAVFCSSETDSFSSVVVDIFFLASETWLSVKSKIYLISDLGSGETQAKLRRENNFQRGQREREKVH